MKAMGVTSAACNVKIGRALKFAKWVFKSGVLHWVRIVGKTRGSIRGNFGYANLPLAADEFISILIYCIKTSDWH